jgi:hypothetical protein
MFDERSITHHTYIRQVEIQSSLWPSVAKDYSHTDCKKVPIMRFTSSFYLPSWRLLLSFLVLQGDDVFSWNITPNPVVATINSADSISNSNVCGGVKTIDTSLLLQDHLDRMGATRFCEIGETKFGRGLVATKDLKPGETVLRIPLSETIIVETEQSDQQGLIDDPWAVKLAMKLLQRQQSRKNDNKDSSKYSDALPPPPPTPTRGWSVQALQTLEDVDILQKIETQREWQDQQWKSIGEDLTSDRTTPGDHQRFLDALDLVSSRTIRCGSKFMLVPFLDMANHASRDEGGGFYKIIDDDGPLGSRKKEIALKVGDRGVHVGDEVLLDYGDRNNDEWMLYYGFLPNRNSVESLILPESRRTITWDDVNGEDESLKEECRVVLNLSCTALQEDIDTLNKIEWNKKHKDFQMELALRYRIARKTLLSAVAGVKTSSAFSSAFLNI